MALESDFSKWSITSHAVKNEEYNLTYFANFECYHLQINFSVNFPRYLSGYQKGRIEKVSDKQLSVVSPKCPWRKHLLNYKGHI